MGNLILKAKELHTFRLIYVTTVNLFAYFFTCDTGQ